MSRLIIKGLPSRYDDKQLRELFSFAGEVTDAKVIKTRDGKSRQFGFVGFRTSQQAKSARHRLNKSYVDTAKVSVDFAHAVGGESIPRPWSKYSEGSSLHAKKTRRNEEDFRKEFLRKEGERNQRRKDMKQRQAETVLSEKDKAAMDEFQEIAGRRASNPVWADGSLRATAKSVLVPSKKKGGEGKVLERKHLTFNAVDSEDEDDALYEELPNTSVPVESASSPVEKIPVAGDSVALNEDVSDMDYFRSKVVHNSAHGREIIAALSEEKAGSEEENGREDKGEQETSFSLKKDDDEHEQVVVNNDREKRNQSGKSEVVRKNMEATDGIDAAETGRLLVRNLAFSVTDEELETAFETFGTLADVHVVKDSQTGKSRGMAFVQYVIPENAPQALVAMDGSFHSGRIMHVLPAKPRPESLARKSRDPRAAAGAGYSSFKAEKEESQKEAARRGLDSSAQHSLHMASDAVAQVMAERHGVSKADLYGTSRGESGIAAIRLAMAEATIQGETRQFLLDHGVDLRAMDKADLGTDANTAAAKRKRQSRTAFLVKNLPGRTVRTQLEEVFVRFGLLKRLVVVPSGLLAVVEYSSASEAKRAYNGLAYTKFRDTPLYLEWLPSEALQELKNADSEDLPSPSLDEHLQAPSGVEKWSAQEQQQNASVYVKNLNFDTRDAVLKAHFARVLRKRPKVAASLRSATVAMKRGPEGKGAERLSMGFGFLEFSSKENAMEALKVAQNTVLDGHTLQLRLSRQGEDSQPRHQKRKMGPTKVAKAGPKLLVRNVAFEATKRDIRQLFSAFGQLKTVRIPRKLDGSHRGFAFVEFASKNEAKSAFEALSSAHLYGRHLVIEYADESSAGLASIGELQEKAAAQMAKKKIRMSDGTPVEAINDPSTAANADEQAMLEDELYG